MSRDMFFRCCWWGEGDMFMPEPVLVIPRDGIDLLFRNKPFSSGSLSGSPLPPPFFLAVEDDPPGSILPPFFAAGAGGGLSGVLPPSLRGLQRRHCPLSTSPSIVRGCNSKPSSFMTIRCVSPPQSGHRPSRSRSCLIVLVDDPVSALVSWGSSLLSWRCRCCCSSFTPSPD